MTDDLVKRLRVRAEFTGPYSALWDEAADRVEELQSKVDTVRLAAKYAAKIRDGRIEKLEAALARIAKHDLQAIAMDALCPGERIRTDAE